MVANVGELLDVEDEEDEGKEDNQDQDSEELVGQQLDEM